MIDGGSGNIENGIESLYNSYEVICLMEDIPNPLSRDKIKSCIQAGYEHHIRQRRAVALKFINGEIDTIEYVTKCILHTKGETPFLWLEMHTENNGNVIFYIIKQPEEVKDE